jgi:hypothetical protein
MDAVRSSETWVNFYRDMWRHLQEERSVLLFSHTLRALNLCPAERLFYFCGSTDATSNIEEVQRQVIGLLPNNELERIWKEAVVA